MGYYRGDHYRRFAGDYYRGDPGFFSFIGKAIKGAARVVGGAAMGFISGGGIKGAIVGAAGGAGLAVREGIQQETLAAGDQGSAMTPELREAHAAAIARAAAKSGLPMIRTLGGPPMATVGGGMPGYVHGLRPNKSTYVTRGGGTSHWPQQLIIHPKHTELVKSRRMNVGNARALRRALRRASGFAKLARRVLRTTHQFKAKGFPRGRAKARR